MSELDLRHGDPFSPRGAGAPLRDSLSVDYELTRGLVENVSHHLRTPLTVVLGHAELLVDRKDELPACVHQPLASVLQAGRRLQDVVAGVCDLVDVAWGEVSIADPVDVSGLVADEVAKCRGRAAHRGVRLLISGDLTHTCAVDARRLRRALSELLDNALTYAPHQSTVRVVTTLTATCVRIRVSDHGDGIDPADRERLVKPFERGTHPRQPADGRGMGLALASIIAAKHGGRLILSECLGGGLQACLELPTGPRREPPRARPPRSPR